MNLKIFNCLIMTAATVVHVKLKVLLTWVVFFKKRNIQRHTQT